MMETRPWLQHYDEDVPHTLQPYPERTLLDVVSDSARQRPDHPALLFKDVHVSYRELERLSDAFGGALAALGVQKGDRVALLLPNCPQTVIAQLGAWKAGAIAAPINPLYTEGELEHGLNECGAETAVVLTPFYDKIKALQPRTGLQRVIATNIKEYLPPLQRILFTLLMEKREGHRVALQAEDLWFADLLRHHTSAPGPGVTVGPDDPALLIFTGGTTGRPKAALARHQSLLMSGMQLRAWSASILDEWDDVLLLLMPMFHMYGSVGVLTLGLACHSPLALVPNPSDLDDLVATMRKVRPAFVPGVPTLFTALLEHADVKSGKVDLGSIKLCISGAAPLMAETKERFERLTGARILEGYASPNPQWPLFSHRWAGNTGSVRWVSHCPTSRYGSSMQSRGWTTCRRTRSVRFCSVPRNSWRATGSARTRPPRCCGCVQREILPGLAKRNGGSTRGTWDTWTRTAFCSSWTARSR
jgi:long-chain acyl-CoA synthetase